MIKDIREFSNQEQQAMLLTSISYPMYVANIDKENFQKFKNGKEEELSDYQLREVNILSILENLGYPMDELGTYLYKDMIMEICEYFEDDSLRENMSKLRLLLPQLSDAYSNFYYNMAKEDKEIGISSFHLYIQKAIDKIDNNLVDLTLYSKIFGKDSEELNYGLQAFQIASYTSQLYSYDETQHNQIHIVKKLSNLPNNISLKYNF